MRVKPSRVCALPAIRRLTMRKEPPSDSLSNREALLYSTVFNIDPTQHAFLCGQCYSFKATGNFLQRALTSGSDPLTKAPHATATLDVTPAPVLVQKRGTKFDVSTRKMYFHREADVRGAFEYLRSALRPHQCGYAECVAALSLIAPGILQSSS